MVLFYEEIEQVFFTRVLPANFLSPAALPHVSKESCAPGGRGKENSLYRSGAKLFKRQGTCRQAGPLRKASAGPACALELQPRELCSAFYSCCSAEAERTVKNSMRSPLTLVRAPAIWQRYSRAEGDSAFANPRNNDGFRLAHDR